MSGWFIGICILGFGITVALAAVEIANALREIAAAIRGGL